MKKEKILLYLRGQTKTCDLDDPIDFEELTASRIAEKAELKRSTASQYLNQLVRTGDILKIETRPVLFLHKQELEERFLVVIHELEFESVEQLRNTLQKEVHQEHAFAEVIGAQGILYEVLGQLKAAASYPPKGLPVLINGPTGSGKSSLAKQMMEYAVKQKILDDSSPFVTLNCAEFADNPELLTANLFGAVKGAYTGADKDMPGLLEKAEKGVLFLDEVHCLSSKGQEKLFVLMDQNKYRRLGDNANWVEANVRMIFATTEEPKEALLPTFLRRIPMIIKIPALSEYSVDERKQLMVRFLLEESKEIKKEIQISRQAFQALLGTEYEGNVGELKNVIKQMCATAYMQDRLREGLHVHWRHLPVTVIQQMVNRRIEYHYEEEQSDLLLISEEMVKTQNKERLNHFLDFHQDIGLYFERLFRADMESEHVISECLTLVTQYYDYLMFQENEDLRIKPKLELMNTTLRTLAEMIHAKYGVQMDHDSIRPLSLYLNECGLFYEQLVISEKAMNRILNYLQVNYPKEYMIGDEFHGLIKNNLDFEYDSFVKIIILLNLYALQTQISNEKILGVILSHGYSTASSIANATNKMVGKYIFEAIDMPLDVSTETIITRLRKFMYRMHAFKKIILMVDMGSLEDICDGLSMFEDRTIGVINNITTRLALEIGFQIIQGKEIEEILEKTSRSIVPTYQIMYAKDKPKAILVSCATGIGTAKKFVELFQCSLPFSLDFTFIPCDYRQVVSDEYVKKIREKYDVEIIFGTMNPKRSDIPYVAIEDIVSGNEVRELDLFFNKYLPENHFEELNREIVKNFSLQNLLEHLTILNPDKVVDSIQEALDLLQRQLNVQFQNRTIMSLYIHLSCLIERLIMKNEIDRYPNLEEFQEGQLANVRMIKESMKSIEMKYSVEIPIAEIGYIFDIISQYIVK